MKCIEFTAVEREVRLICIYIDITGIYLFDQIVSMACAKVRLRCSWILLVLISSYCKISDSQEQWANNRRTIQPYSKLL